MDVISRPALLVKRVRKRSQTLWNFNYVLGENIKINDVRALKVFFTSAENHFLPGLKA